MALFSTAGLARGSARHPWLILLLWVVLIAGAAVAQGNLDSALGGDDSFTNNPDAKQGADLIEERLRGSDPMNETVIVRSETATVDDPAFRAEVEQTTATLLGFTDGVASATSYYDLVAAGDPSAEQLVSDDRHTTIIPVTLLTVDDEMVAEPEEYVDLVETLGGDGFEVYSVGSATADVTFGEIVSEDIAKGEMVGIPIAIVVLIVVFGALVAVGLPLILALVSIFIAVGLAALVGQVLPLEDTVISLITMIGLAVGIDYALFVVERYREERRRGVEKRDAIEHRRSQRQQSGRLLRRHRDHRAAGHVPDPGHGLPGSRHRRGAGRHRRGPRQPDVDPGNAEHPRRQDRLAPRASARPLLGNPRTTPPQSTAASGAALPGS